MSHLNSLLALANEAAELATVDMSEVSKGAERKLLPAGYKIGTLVEYLEFGKQPREYKNEVKTPLLAFRLGFALHNVNEDGTPYVLRTFDLSLGNNEKAKAKIAFDRMNYRKTAKHFAQLLGQSFLVEIKVVKSATTGKERNEINFATIAPPFDPVSQQPYPIPTFDDKYYRLFLWDKPTQEGWDSMFIEGTTDDGKSKNYLQEACKAAVDYPGSALEQLLGGGIPDLTVPAELKPEAVAGAAVAELPKLEVAASVAPSTPVSASTPSSTAPLADIPQLASIPALP